MTSDDHDTGDTYEVTATFEGWRPEIVCLCGSTRFKDQFREANARFTLDGKIVLTVGFFHHADGIPDEAKGKAIGEDGEWKHKVDHLHFRKIDLADRVHVINPGGYIGESTRKEIEYAREHGVPITWLQDPHDRGVGNAE